MNWKQFLKALLILNAFLVRMGNGIAWFRKDGCL